MHPLLDFKDKNIFAYVSNSKHHLFLLRMLFETSLQGS